MNRTVVKYIVLTAAIASVAVGLLLTLQTMHQINDTSEHMKVRIEQIATVQSLSAGVAEYNAALDLYEKIPQARLRPVSKSIKEVFPEFRADTIKDFKRETMPGWVFYEKEVAFGDADVAAVIDVLRKLELQRPPWRLVKCLVKTSSRQPGTGRIIVTLEGLEKEL